MADCTPARHQTSSFARHLEPNPALRKWELLAAAGCLIIALYTAFYPVYRACFPLEVSYNEGWNVYNAWIVAHHLPLYGSPAGWTTVNYPALSFFLIAQLSKLTHDFLYTGRALSLLGLASSGLFGGLIVFRLTRSKMASILSALYCIAIFCSCGDFYVGADDPQLLAQGVFAAALLLYVLYRENDFALVGVAALFAVAGSIKHNQIDFPLAVLIDLWLISRRRARNFFLMLAVSGAVVIAANIVLGGRYFLDALLTPRLYSPMRLLHQSTDYYPPLLIPFAAACFTAFKARRQPQARVISIFFAISFFLGLFFSGGVGVSINAYFSNTFAIAVLLGLFLHELRIAELPTPQRLPHWKAAVPLVLFLWLLIPLACNEILGLTSNLQKIHKQSGKLSAQVELLRAQPGPVLCESLLRCYLAGKPYIYDPFNSTSLINAGRLDAETVAQRVRSQEYGAIQFNHPPRSNGEPSPAPERFASQILTATSGAYRVEVADKDCTIYVPQKSPAVAATTHPEIRVAQITRQSSGSSDRTNPIPPQLQ